MEWSHTTLGQFDNAEQWIGLDFRNHFLDPIRAEATLFHELTHSLISRTTDMGQAMQNIAFFMPKFKHLSKDEKKQLTAILMECQFFPQEGFATFMGMQRLRQRTSWPDALGTKSLMPKSYLEVFEKMEFMFGKRHSMREHFTRKVSLLVMENGFRKDAPKLDLLRSPAKLKEYLDNPAHNPTARLERVLAAARIKDRVVIEKPRKLAKLCRLEFFEPATREEVAAFINYVLGLAGLKQEYTPSMIGRSDGKQALTDSIDNVLITNINLNLKEGAVWVWETEAIEYEATHANAAFIVQHSLEKVKHQDFLEKNLERKFETDIILFDKDNQKFVSFSSLEHTERLLHDQLKDKTIITKWGICNPVDSSFTISSTRKPDVIIYNRPVDMLNALRATQAGIKKFEYIHIGVMQGHPFQMLLVKINGHDTVHFANGFGDAGIAAVIDHIKPRGKSVTLKEFKGQARAINDTLGTLGLRWDVDWVATMQKKDEIIWR